MVLRVDGERQAVRRGRILNGRERHLGPPSSAEIASARRKLRRPSSSIRASSPLAASRSRPRQARDRPSRTPERSADRLDETADHLFDLQRGESTVAEERVTAAGFGNVEFHVAAATDLDLGSARNTFTQSPSNINDAASFETQLRSQGCGYRPLGRLLPSGGRRSLLKFPYLPPWVSMPSGCISTAMGEVIPKCGVGLVRRKS